jgi:hypothetical protein
MRVVTIGVMSGALAVSTVGLSGSTPPSKKAIHQPAAVTTTPAVPHTR